VKLTKYARDFRAWQSWANVNYRASRALFESGDAFLLFPAAILGHHALEMQLKAALISAGITIFDPKKLKVLDPGIIAAEADCVWGHELVRLAEKLAQRNSAFDLSKSLDFFGYVLDGMMTIREGLAIFDPFFAELRYPEELQKVTDLGEEHLNLLDALVAEVNDVGQRTRA
jgi:hypothetical protein